MYKTLILSLLLASSALAQVRIDQVLVRRRESTMNLRVNISNPGTTTQRGPIRITLYARPDDQSPWEEVKVWANIQKLPAGHRVARDFFDQNNARLAEISAAPAFEAKAVVEAPGCPTEEQTSVFHPDP